MNEIITRQHEILASVVVSAEQLQQMFAPQGSVFPPMPRPSERDVWDRYVAQGGNDSHSGASWFVLCMSTADLISQGQLTAGGAL